MDKDFLLRTDGYKLTHWRMYPPGTTALYAYLEARKGGNIPFFGLQYYLMKYLAGPVVNPRQIYDATVWSKAYMGAGHFNADGWWHVLNDHNGVLPLSIRALPEGTVVPAHTPMLTVENTCERCYWLVPWVEGLIEKVWYTSTVAWLSRSVKNVIKDAFVRTGSDLARLPYALHDFGYRGASSDESAGLGAMAHLLNFRGTDTLLGMAYAQYYYFTEAVAQSIPASEHSTVMTWGRRFEAEAYQHAITQFDGPISMVSDTYNIYEAVDEIWGGVLHREVVNRRSPVVIRPDSGDPLQTILYCLNSLDASYGHTLTPTGHKLLDPCVRIIYGDGMTPAMIAFVLKDVADAGWAAENLVFGMGGGLLQKVNRDDLSFAYKASWAIVNREEREFSKAPVTDAGKQSKSGRFSVYRTIEGTYITATEDAALDDLLEPVFVDGQLLKYQSFAEIRSRVEL